MSEYQYYEFQAIDRPLSDKEMRELRSYSTRARITPTSFVNDYSWGDFKGDADAWMEKYFDAFMYLANWGTHILKLRLPSRLLDPKIAMEYCSGDSSFLREKDGRVILSFVSEEHEDDDWVEEKGGLSSLISVRSELARGDLRALYLGWLLCAQTGDLDDDQVEPPMPSGLGQLSASLESLAEFLRIDSNLLHVAAQSSTSLDGSGLERDDVRRWAANLRSEEKDELLTKFVVDGGQTTVNELLHRFRNEGSGIRTYAAAPRRTIGELLSAAESSAAEKRRIETDKRAREKDRRERETALAREKHLDSLTGREPKVWAEIEALIATRQPKRYDDSIKLLADLRDLYSRVNGGDFPMRLEALRKAHAQKPALIERLKKAGL